MTDETMTADAETKAPAGETEAASSETTAPLGTLEADYGNDVRALKARIAELEKVVHTLAAYSRAHEHGVVVAWLEKEGARIKAAVEKAL